MFVKAFGEPPADDVFAAEAEGLAALREARRRRDARGDPGGPRPARAVGAAAPAAQPRPSGSSSRTRSPACTPRTTHPRFGWHRDNWLGRRRQVNTWDDDGFAFFAQHRLLRWLGEPRVEAALDAADRAALERLCDRLPELLPDRPACLTHGDLWAQNVLATPDGRPALIDPAVSYTWAEVDLAHLWSTAPPPEAHGSSSCTPS